MENLDQILKEIHAERYETSDKGFGRLYADVFKNQHRYNPQRKDFMLYDGKRWVDDTEGLAAKADAKRVKKMINLTEYIFWKWILKEKLPKSEHLQMNLSRLEIMSKLDWE